jgi:hypothetical protein
MGGLARGLTFGTLFLAAACGGSEEAATNAPEAVDAEAGERVEAEPVGWNAADACALVDTATVAEAAGTEVTGTQLAGASQGGNGLASLSTCIYTLGNGSSVAVLTRQSPTPDFSRQAVETARTANGMMPAAVDVPDLGRAALWTRETNTLQVFLDDSRYAAITVGNPKGVDTRAIATAIGAKLAG